MTDSPRISTHVLDIALGRSAEGIPLLLELHGLAGIWKQVGKSRTDGDGRSGDICPHSRITFRCF